MRTSTLIRATTLAAVLGLAGSVYADNFRTKTGASYWRVTGSWEQDSGGGFGTATRVPDIGDSVSINHDIGIDDPEAVTTLSIDSVVSLTVYSGGSLELGAVGATNPSISLTINGANLSFLNGSELDIPAVDASFSIHSGATFEVDTTALLSLSSTSTGFGLTVTGQLQVFGTIEMNSSDVGVPYVRIQSSQAFPQSGGELVGDVASELRIDSGVTVTNGDTIRGDITVKGIGGGNFVNSGTVHADADVLMLDSSLNAVSGAGVWIMDQGSTLTFNKAATGLTGSITMNGSTGGGTLNVNQNVSTTGRFTYNHGTINVATGKSFCFSLVTDTCGGLPASCFNGPVTVAPCP